VRARPTRPSGATGREMGYPVAMDFARSVDTFLDRSIALGYGKVGLRIRERLAEWPADPPRMDGKVALVTGAASGLGLATAVGYARLGASVRAHARSADRADEAVAEILRQSPGSDVRPVDCDISSLAAIRAFVGDFVAAEDRLDVLVNNAGVMPPERTRSADGAELMFATHVLATWALIDGFAPLLRTSAPARVINVSSGGMYSQSIPAGDLQSERASYNPNTLYARTKREQVVITEQWAERLDGTGVVVHAMHPGWVDTKGIQDALPGFLKLVRPIIRTPEEGADTIVWLGASPEPLASTGGFWSDRRLRPTHYRLGAGEDSAAARAEVWAACERLAGAEAVGPR
jgi:dehydrogenase/reductase SDR family member 12